MAGAVLAAIGVVVLVVALIALRSPSRNGTSAGTRTVTESVPVTAPATSGSSSRPPSSSSRPPSSSSSAAAGKLPLVVLNDTSTSNLATVAADRFRSGGWTVTSTDENYQNNILSTAAYYDPDVTGAKAAAEALQQQFSAIQRVVPKFTGLPDGPIVVVLTADYSSG